MIRVFISPNYFDAPPEAENGGIRRVVDAMVEYLPQFGVEVVRRPDEADIINNHGQMLVEREGIPTVHTGHGFYWSRQPWGTDFQDVNRMVAESMAHAVAHTVPSNWVNIAVRRGGYWFPETVYHGVKADEFKPADTNQGYVIWNKARADFVSDPKDMQRVAALLPQRRFVTTIGTPTENVTVLNPDRKGQKWAPVSYERMKKIVAEAGVYLSTARETFGIGTLEALAAGIPVAGWDWGGNSEIIINGETGYLAYPGDFKELAECIERCYAERERLSANAYEDARERWTWEPRIEQYANIFKRVYSRYYERVNKPKVSVIITAYKLDEFLPDCLSSVKQQTFNDFECLVVDDANLKSTKKIVESFSNEDSRIRYCPTGQNLGLPGARNRGFSQSHGLYIRHVDADDMLAKNALELEVTALDKDHGIHIAYGHLEVVRTDGSRVLEGGEPKRSGWPETQFNWQQQMSHLNQIPSCAMFRREVFERSGGYRARMKRQEDAEFYCRVTSLGFRAKKITEAVTYFHRERHDSKGAMEWKEQGKEPDWTAWFPWRMGSTDYPSAVKMWKKYGVDSHPNAPLVPFGAQGQPPKEVKFWYVHDYSYPVVSVIVTCGPGHESYLLDALDSIQAQDFPDWECIVVNDTGKEWKNNIPGAPWAKVVNMDGNQGVSAARNEGFKYANGRYIVWMDGDDYWLPWFLSKTVSFAEENDGVIYGDGIIDSDGKPVAKWVVKGGKAKLSETEFITHGEPTVIRYPEFNSANIVYSGIYPGTSILHPRKIVQAVFDLQGGYDKDIPGMEDWDWQIAVHHLGFCAYHVPEPIFIYRMNSSTKRDADYAKIEQIREYIDNKWPQYRLRKEPIVCGCNKKKIPAKSQPKSMLRSSGNFQKSSVDDLVADSNDSQQMVSVEYTGTGGVKYSFRSRVVPGLMYTFKESKRIQPILLGDVKHITSMQDRGQPLFRVLSGGSSEEVRDPSAFLGQPIAA